MILGATSKDRPEVAAFVQALQELGWTEGRNVRMDYRSGLGNAADTRRYVAELATLAPDVIFASGTPVLAPLLQATRTVPIVFAKAPGQVDASQAIAARTGLPKTERLRSEW